MSVDKHLTTKGINLTEDNQLPRGERTQKNVSRIIAAARAAEAEWNEELVRCQREVIDLQDRIDALEKELLRYRFKETAEGIKTLAIADRERLQACVE